MKLNRLLFTSALLAAGTALAGSLSWTGASSNEWNTTDANWTGDGTVYADGDAVLFDGTSGEITNIVSRSPNSTTVDSNSKVTFSTGISNSNDVVIGGPSILTGALIKNGTGELELGDPALGPQWGGANKNQYSNGFSSVTVNAGTLRIRSRAALGLGPVTLAGGTTFKQSSEAARYGINNEWIDNDFVLSGGMVDFPMDWGASSGLWIRNGIVSGPGGIRVFGSGREMALSANNTYSGGTIIDSTSSTQLIIAAYSALGTGTFTANQSQQSGGGLIAGIDLPGNATYPDGVTNDFVIPAGKYLNVYGKNSTINLRIGGEITGDGILNKTNNDSTLILSGNNSYSGGTIVADGTLVCESVNSLGTGPITIGTGALLQLDFVGSINVATLTIDGSAVANGTYGSSVSPAENHDDVHFSGLGMINVGPPKTDTTTTLAQTAGANPTDIGLSVTLTATVSGAAPSGTVVFYDGLTALGSASLDGAFQASIATTELPEGVRNVVAQYEGDATYASSTSAPLAIEVVDSRETTTMALTLSSGTNPAASGASLTYTAAVSGASPTGTVRFYDRGNLLASSALDGASQASVTTSTLPLGRRLITAEYDGDLDNKPSRDTYAQSVSAPAGNGKLKVFILAGQSNMEGRGQTDLGRDPEDLTGAPIVGGIGSLRGAALRDPLEYGYLLDEDNLVGGLPSFITRDDVYISYRDAVNGGTGVKREGYLDINFGFSSGGFIGPEYGFGHVMGAGLGDDVLIIKIAWGGKSLFADFRPPSSGGTVGPYYLHMVANVHTVLNNLTTYFPDYDGGGYEIVGFGWHQGWNDKGHEAEYEANLVNLIHDIRAEFSVPDLPFVVANSGMGGAGSLIEPQGNVADPALHPELAGTVTTVDTRPFFYGTFQSPVNEGFHWNRNGESLFQIGEAMGSAMLALLEPGSPFSEWAKHSDQGLTAGVNDGPLDDPDFDGITNLMEFILGGDPLVPDSDKLPTMASPSTGIWTFEYDRNNDSAPGVNQVVEYVGDLSTAESWNQIPIPETTAGNVTITPGAGFSRVSVEIPFSGPNGFARLVVAE